MTVTWNPSDKSALITLSNGNLTATKTNTSYGTVRATESKSSGKFYWEVKIDVTESSTFSQFIGIATSAAGLYAGLGYDAYGWGYTFGSTDGAIGHNSVFTNPWGDKFQANDIIGIALDLDNGKLWWSKNNVWQESGDPANGTNPAYTGLSGTFFPAVTIYTVSNAITARFKTSDFDYSPPTGFNSYEEEAVIEDDITLNDQFEVVSLTDEITNASGLNDQFEATNLSDEISNESSINDQLDVNGIFYQSTNEEFGINDSFEAINLTSTLSEEFSINDQLQRSFETNRSISNTSGISDAFECFNWTQWLFENEYRAVKAYYFTLTGDSDSTTDVEISISSFQCRLRSGDPTYLSIVIPGINYSDEIIARSNGDLVIDMAYKIDGEISQREEIVRVELEDIRIDQGARNQSVTLSGHKTETFGSKIVTLQDVTYMRSLNGKLTYRTATPDLFLRPGDTVKYNTDEFTVGLISYTVAVNRQQMEVTEA